MIRVLAGSPRLEAAIRASPSLEFAGIIDPSHAPAEFSGDVLVIEGDPNEDDWQMLADLPIPVVVLLDSPDSARSALRAGIRGAILLDATPQEIEAAVQAVYAGLVVMASASLIEQFDDEPVEPLSERELEVLDLLAEGLSNKLVAHRLSISEHTVKTHVASIFGKLGVSSRTEAVSRAIRKGLVML